MQQVREGIKDKMFLSSPIIVYCHKIYDHDTSISNMWFNTCELKTMIYPVFWVSVILVSFISQIIQMQVYTGKPLHMKFSRNKQFAFTNIVQANELRLTIHLVNTEPCAYEHFNKLTLTNLMMYLMEK
jgi:hypothetical protein